LLQDIHELAGYDLIFYTYDSRNTPAANSGALFKQFLNQLFEEPLLFCNATLDPEAARLNSFQYKNVLIVAHSLGAVVSRLALVNAFLE
jgi:alpha-beta hydrolase superfamily lysophospholipase